LADEIDGYVEENAPELDPGEVRKFIESNEKPSSEPGTEIEWATRTLRARRQDEQPDGPPLEMVEEEMRRHDERQE